MPIVRRTFQTGLCLASVLLPSQQALAASTERVSVDSAGVQANDSSSSRAISADGRFVAFQSDASNLVAGDTNTSPDVFVRDRLTGTTERISVATGGAEGNASSTFASISGDGRFVVFSSGSTNLVAGDSNARWDIFLRDRKTGTTTIVSRNTAGVQADGNCYDPAISADGRFVAFHSFATNLAAGDTNADWDVFVRDLQTNTTERVSVSSAEAQAVGGESRDASISADGRFVSFYSETTNLVTGDTNGTTDVFVRDRIAGTTERISLDSAEAQADGESDRSSISGDGRFVAFYSVATNLVPDDTNGQGDVFVRDRKTGTTERVSLHDNGSESSGGAGTAVAISQDGRFVAFFTYVPLVDGEADFLPDIYVRDRRLGRTELVSVPDAGGEGDQTSWFPSISATGRFVAFQSQATNLVNGDTNGVEDIYLRDRGLLADGRNDVLVDFGAAGLWQMLNNTSWQKIHNASPAVIDAGDLNGSFRDDAIVTFSGAGLWARFDDATWVKLHKASPARLVAGDLDGNGADDLVVDFGPAGLWIRHDSATWTKIHNGTSEGLAIGDFDGNGKDDVIVDFGAPGLFTFHNGGWVKLNASSPETHMVAGDLDDDGRDELIADFGASGLWVMTSDIVWSKIHNATTQGLAVGDFDGNGEEDLLVNFGGAGLWVRYNGGTWVKRHNSSPTHMVVTDLDDNGQADAIVDFGAGGLWVRYNDASWVKRHNAATQALAAGRLDD